MEEVQQSSDLAFSRTTCLVAPGTIGFPLSAVDAVKIAIRRESLCLLTGCVSQISIV